MLPENDGTVMQHVRQEPSDQSLLDEFRKENPQLVPVEWDGRGTLCAQLWHITFLNHREYSRGMNPECCHQEDRRAFMVTDHSELWQDRETQDLVQIAHPNCNGRKEDFEESAKFLKERGLNLAVSNMSWYNRETTKLVVVARPRTLDRIEFDPESIMHFNLQHEEWDTRKIAAIKQATEQVDTDKWFADAEDAEARGEHDQAALLFIDNAHNERTGRFNQQALRNIRRAGDLLRNHHDETVVTIATRSFLTYREIRMVFKYAGMTTPEWLEKMWRNGKQDWKWKRRTEPSEDGQEQIEYNRCIICEEWIRDGEGFYSPGLGHMHDGRSCLAEAAGISMRYLH